MSFTELVTVLSHLKDPGVVHPLQATVCLGSGSSLSAGIGSWPTISENICRDLAIKRKHDESAIDAVKTHFQGTVNEPSGLRALVLDKYLGSRHPTAGYNYLAVLVAEGYVDTILTTNWDCLVEQSLYSTMSPDKVRVLVRGDMTDDRIAEYLEHPRTPATVVKLHGDLIAGIFYITPNETDKCCTISFLRPCYAGQRRLFFVGISRVKSVPNKGKPGRLILTYSQQMAMAAAMGAGIAPAGNAYGISILHASRFLQELGPAAPAPIAG